MTIVIHIGCLTFGFLLGWLFGQVIAEKTYTKEDDKVSIKFNNVEDDE